MCSMDLPPAAKSFRFPHASVQIQPAPPPNSFNRQGHGQNEGDSPEDICSGNESSIDVPNKQAGQGVKRKRSITVSCELCKHRKVKCDRAQPSCGWCTRNGQSCEYRERKKPGLRAGYGRELERRLDRLEDIIQSQAQMIETHMLNTSQPQPAGYQGQPGTPLMQLPSPPEHSVQPDLGRQPATSYQEDSPGLSASHRTPVPRSYTPDNQLLTPTTEPSVHTRSQSLNYNGDLPGSQVSQAENPCKGFSCSNSTPRLPINLTSTQNQPLTNSDVDLPPYDLLYSLVDLYFEHVNTWCPILHRRTTLDTLFGPSPLKEEDRILLYAIVATTLRFSTDARLNEDNRARYYEISKQKVLIYGVYNSSVTALQALVILSLDFVGSSHGPPAWKLLALIARSVVQLGLAHESTSSLTANMFPSIYTLKANILPDAKTWVEDEERRRLFWMVYSLDRSSTVATAFDFALDDKEIDRKLPCKNEYFQRNHPSETRWFESQGRTDYGSGSENLGSFGFYLEVVGILSRTHLFLKRPVDITVVADVEQWQTRYKALDNELTAWENQLPKKYAFDKERLNAMQKGGKSIDCGWIMLHAAYQTTIIRLHSSAAYPTTRSSIFMPSYSASQRCLKAVENIRLLTRYVVDNNFLDKLGHPFAFTLWVSARLLLVHGSTIARTLDPKINFFVDTLRRMGKYWKVAERYSTILQRVLDEYSEYEQSAGKGGERPTPSSVKILADMRRCAFDLDLLISRQPRHHRSLSASPRTSPTPARSLSQSELEYLDVFGFFNLPRLPSSQTIKHREQDVNYGGGQSSSGTHSHPSSVVHKKTVSDFARNTKAVPPAGTLNEFNITNYMIPTPETDWLFRKAQ